MTTLSASEVILVDSSGWLEYATEDTRAADFLPYIEGLARVLVPTIVQYEVFKKLRVGHGQTAAQRFVSHALRKKVIPLDDRVALAAAEASIEHRLSMADAVIYATARSYEAQLVTSDTHFQGLPGVTVI